VSTNFRFCTESDLAIVREYVSSLYQEDPPGMKMNAAKFDRTFWEFTNKSEKGRIVVFERDNLVVGYAIIVFYWSNEYGGDFIEVDELFTHEDYRGNGIATAFFEWLAQTWYQKAVALSIQVTPANDRANSFYQRLGFRISKNRHMMKLLPNKVNCET
jgi:GNAT superfamily N-acetyltransferase